MDYDRAIKLLESGTEMPEFPHTFEEIDEACKLGVEAMRYIENAQQDVRLIHKLNKSAYADRDRWKARAEALEQAIKENIPCETCICEWPKDCGLCEVSFGDTNENNWQFDEARFTAKATDEPNQQQQ